MQCSLTAQVARFRELMNAKKLHEESKTPHSLSSNLNEASRSATTTTTTSGQSSSAGATTWPLQQQRGISLNLNDQLEKEYQSKIMNAHAGPASAKENSHPTNLATMTQIMRRKQMMTHAARKELDDSPTMENTATIPAFDEKEDNSSSSWAMLGCHMDETTLDYDGASELLLMESSELAVTPLSQWKEKQYYLNTESLSSGNCMRSGEDGVSGISGVLTILGDSPLFDQTLISSEEDDNEVERNLCGSAEKVRRLEEHLLRSAGEGILSPVNPPPSSNGRNNRNFNELDTVRQRERTKEVTIALQDELQTPRDNPHLTYPKSPYYFDDNTDDINMSMQVQANPMNESAIISEDETSEQDFRSKPSMECVGSTADEAASDSLGCGNEFDSNESSEIGMLGFGALSSIGVSGKSRLGVGKDATPTRASLMERNHTLVKEVRFADQTCVALSERKKYYKNQVGQYVETIKAANKENSALRHNFESSLQESARLKVMVESLRAQKNQADLQVEAYRAQIIDSEQTHRSSMEKLEKTHSSHLKSAKEQIDSLNERLNQSYATNASLQSTLDKVNNKLESKVQNDAASKALIASLKERVASGDTAVLNANSSVEAMSKRISELEKLCDQQKNQLQQERAGREMTENNREDLQSQCDDLHMQLTEWAQTSVSLENLLLDYNDDENQGFVGDLKRLTPVKHLGSDALPRTPTSNLLARTLRSELKRRQHVTINLESAERQVTVLKDRIFDMKMDHEEAKADNALLEEELEEMKCQIANLETTLAEKDNQVDLLCEEVEDLRRDGAVSTDDTESRTTSRSQCRRDTISVLEERLVAVEETLEFTDDELTETKARLADTQELLEQTASELERSKEELAIASSLVPDYEIQVGNLLKDLTEKDVDRANITKFSDFQSSTIEAMKDKLSQSEKVNAELRVQLNSCFQSLAATEKILRTYEDTGGVAGKTMSEQSRKIARLMETLKQAPQDRIVSMETHEFDSVSTRMYSNEPRAMTAVCLKCINSQEELRFEQDDGNCQLLKALKVITDLRDELSTEQSEHAEQIQSLTSQCTELEENLSAVRAELKICKMENEALSKTVTATENATSQQLSVIRSNNSELIKENETLRVSLQSRELELESERALRRDAQDSADSCRLDSSHAKAAFEILRTQCDLTKASLSKVEKQKNEMQELVIQKDKEIKVNKELLVTKQADLQEQIESLKTRCVDLEAELSVERDSHRTADGMLNEASKRVAVLETAVKSIENEFEEKQNECQELIVQVKQIQSALDEAEREHSDAVGTISRLEIDIQEKKSIIFAYEESIISYKSDIRRLDNELQTTVQDKNNRIQMLEQACSSRHAMFSEQMDRTKKERDTFASEVTDMINRLQNELDDQNKSQYESEERSRATILELNEERRTLEKEIIHKQDRLDKETEKYDETRRNLENAKSEILILTDRLNSTEMDCNRLATMHQDEVEELLKDKKTMIIEKNQLEEQV